MEFLSETLNEREKLFALAASATRVGMFDLNIAKRTVLWTQTHDEIFDYTTTASTAPTTTTAVTLEHDFSWWLDRVHPEDLPRVEEEGRRCFQECKPVEIQYRIIWPDGSIHWVETKGIYLFESNGIANRLIGVVREITEQKNLELELLKSRALYSDLIEKTADLVTRVDTDGLILYLNQAAGYFYGLPPEECIGRLAFDTVHPDDRETTIAAFQAWLHGDEEYFTHENRIVGFDGQGCFYVVWTIRAERDEDGNVKGFASTARDITERKLAEKALAAAQRQIQSIIDNTTALIYALDLEGHFILANTALAELLNSTPKQMIGKRRHDFMPKDDADWHDANDRMVYETGKPLELEEYSQLHGNQITWLTTKFPLQDEQGKIYAIGGISADISERKQVEDSLKILNEELEKRVSERTRELRKKDQIMLAQSRLAAMGEMIGYIAHQWRQPLNNLGLLVQQIKVLSDLNQLDKDTVDKNVAQSMQVIQHMSKTIDDFTDFIKPNKHTSDFYVSGIIMKTLRMIEASFSHQNIQVELIADTKVLIRKKNENEYTQVMLAILQNARDAFIEREISEPKITITVSSKNRRSLVTIADNAGGVDQEILEKIFEPYFSTKGPAHGTGIGLFMSKVIIEKSMGGSLGVYNEGGGAVFRVEV